MGTGLAVVNSNLPLSPLRGGEPAAEAGLVLYGWALRPCRARGRVFSDIRGLPKCGPKQALQRQQQKYPQEHPQKDLEKASPPALQPSGRGRTDAGTALQGPHGYGPSPALALFGALPGTLPAQQRVEVPGQISSSARRPRQGPSLCPLSEALPGLGGPVASHSEVPGPAASALPRVQPALSPRPLLSAASSGSCFCSP